MRVGINGMGRTGRLALRAAMGGLYRGADDPRSGNRLDVVHVNELKGGATTTAHLLDFGSIHGRWRERFDVEDNRALLIGNRRIGFSQAATPDAIPWAELGCDLVLECTGTLLKVEQLQGYFEHGVKQVIVVAPVKQSGAHNVVVGVNDHLYEPRQHRLLAAASCTAGAAALLQPRLHAVHAGIPVPAL